MISGSDFHLDLVAMYLHICMLNLGDPVVTGCLCHSGAHASLQMFSIILESSICNFGL